MRRRQRLIAQNEFRNHLLADRSNSKGKTVEPEFYFPENRDNNNNYHHHNHHHNHNSSNRSQSVPPSRSASYYLNTTPYNNSNTHQYSHGNYYNDNNDNDSYSSSSQSDSESYRTPQSINSYSDDSISITDEPQIQRSPLPHQRNPSFIPIKTKNNNNNDSHRSQTNHQHKKKTHSNKHHHNHKKTAINKNRTRSPFKPSFNLSKTTYINRIEDDDEEPQPLPEPKNIPQPEPQINSDDEPEVERRNVDVSDNDDNNENDNESGSDSDSQENTYDIPVINVNRKKSDRATVEELKSRRKEVEKLKKENELMRKYEEERTNDLLLNAYNPRINANTFNSKPPSADNNNPLAFVPNSSNYVQGVSNYDPNEYQNISLSSYTNSNNNKRSNSRSKKDKPRKPLHADALDEKHDHHGNHSTHHHNHSHENDNKESSYMNQSRESTHSHHYQHIPHNSKGNINYNNRDLKGNTLNDISSIEPVNESNAASNFAELISGINRNIDPKNGERNRKHHHHRNGKNYDVDVDIDESDNDNDNDISDNDEENEKDVDYKKVIKHSPQMHFCSEHICCNPPITYYLNNNNLENLSVSNYSESDNNENMNESKKSTTKKSDKVSEHSSKHSSKHSDKHSDKHSNDNNTNHILSQISHSHASTINDDNNVSDDDISVDSIEIERSEKKNVKKQEKQKPIVIDEELKKKQITYVKNESDTNLKSPNQRTHSTSSDPTLSPERNPLINDNDGDSIHDKMQFDDMDSVLKELKDLRKEKHILKHHNEQLNALSHQLHLENKTMREILSKTQTSTESN